VLAAKLRIAAAAVQAPATALSVAIGLIPAVGSPKKVYASLKPLSSLIPRFCTGLLVVGLAAAIYLTGMRSISLSGSVYGIFGYAS